MYWIRYDFNLIISGSNDSQEILNLHPSYLDYYALHQFKEHVEHLVDGLLAIPGAYVILPTIFPRRGTTFDVTNSILEDVVRLVYFLSGLSTVTLIYFTTGGGTDKM